MNVIEHVFSIAASVVLFFALLFLISKRVRSFMRDIIFGRLNRYADERISKFEKKIRVEIGEVNGKIEIISGRIDGIQDKLDDLE